MRGRSPTTGFTLAQRLFAAQAAVFLALLLVLGVVLDRVFENRLVDQLTDGLVSQAHLIQQALPATGSLQPLVVSLGRSAGVRVTVIRTDGVVLADSEADPATMQNHRTRPEVQQALHGRIGVSSRLSATIGIPFRYVALPPQDGRIVRVALPLTAVHARVERVRALIGLGFGLTLLFGLGVLLFVARGSARPLDRLAASVAQMGHGDLAQGVPAGGPREVRTLAATLEAMRNELGSRVAELERSREAREAILASLEEGIVVFDDTERALYRNPAAVRQLGGSLETVRDLPAQLRPLAAPNGPDVVDALPIPATGRILQAAAVTVPGEGQRLLVLRDVTRSTQTDAIRRDFVANASHELKTPAASIRALAETISGALGYDDEAVRGFAVRLEGEAERLSRLVSDLLDLSRVEAAPEAGEQVRFDEVVREEVGRVSERATSGGLTLEVANDGPVWVRGSARDLGLLTRNLVENAVQYTGPGGRVSVHVTAVGGGAELSVADTGIGIPARDRERVFERFYRVDRARSRVTGGTGLGLAIVRHVAENLGGSVEVQSELGRGSTFTVRLPPPDQSSGDGQSTNL